MRFLILLFVVMAFCGCHKIGPRRIQRIERQRHREEKHILVEIDAENAIGFYLYPRNNTEGEKIDLNLINSAHFDPQKETKIIIHGFRHSKDEQWVQIMKEALSSANKWNIIVVDWSPLSVTRYPDARRNTRIVGKHVAKLCDQLAQNGIPLSSIHIIGHSLGAHVAGYAGSNLTKGKIGRITGLDPAKPLFENPALVTIDRRLDDSDAMFVDVIHTNAGGLGCVNGLGHVDFYPNGGVQQPGCDTWKCSHMKACEFFTESVKNPEFFQGFQTSTYRDFKVGNFNQKESATMGMNTKSNSRGIFFLDTPNSSFVSLDS